MRKTNNITYRIESDEMRTLAAKYFKEKTGIDVKGVDIIFEGFQAEDGNEINGLSAIIKDFIQENMK